VIFPFSLTALLQSGCPTRYASSRLFVLTSWRSVRITSSSMVSSVSIVLVNSTIWASISFALTFPFSATSARADSSSALSIKSTSWDSVSATIFSASSIAFFSSRKKASITIDFGIKRPSHPVTFISPLFFPCVISSSILSVALALV